MMKLSDVLRPECVAVGLKVADKDQALREVAHLAKKCSILEPVATETLINGLEDREDMGSTGFGNGIAIPHCRLEGITDFVVGAMTIPSGVDFDAADGKVVRIMAFIVGPKGETTDHLRILSGLSLSLSTPGVRERIVAAQTPREMLECLIPGASHDIDLKRRADMRLFCVIVQDKPLFERILGALESLASASITVIDGNNAGEYLAKVPIFAGLFGNGYAGFNRLIMAVVGKEMTNEAIRRIESVAGQLDHCKNVLVIVQDVFYAAGTLEI